MKRSTVRLIHSIAYRRALARSRGNSQASKPRSPSFCKKAGRYSPNLRMQQPGGILRVRSTEI